MDARRFQGLNRPPLVDRIWGLWGSYYNIPKAIFYLLKGDYNRPPRMWVAIVSLDNTSSLQTSFQSNVVGKFL